MNNMKNKNGRARSERKWNYIELITDFVFYIPRKILWLANLIEIVDYAPDSMLHTCSLYKNT